MAVEATPQVAPLPEQAVSAPAEPLAVITAPALPEYPVPTRVEAEQPALIVSEAPKAEPPSEQPRREQAPEQPPAPQVPAPTVDLRATLDSSGLVMIETDPSKARAVPPQPEQQVPLGRPRRERPQAQAAEPLVQVETHNK